MIDENAQKRKFPEENEYLAASAQYDKEKIEYNQSLDLDEEIETDFEEEGDFPMDHKRGLAIAKVNDCLEERRCEQAWQRYRTDHHTFAQSPRDGTSPRTFHRFLDLPLELRNLVYTFALPQAHHEVRQWQFIYEIGAIDGFAGLRPLDTRLLAVNRQLCFEGLRTLYSSNTFVVDIDGCPDSMPLFIRKSLGSLDSSPTIYIRRWHLIIVFTHPAQKCRVLSQLQKVHDVMRQFKVLESVRFSWITISKTHDGYQQLQREYESMLSIIYLKISARSEKSHSRTIAGKLEGCDILEGSSQSLR